MHVGSAPRWRSLDIWTTDFALSVQQLHTLAGFGVSYCVVLALVIVTHVVERGGRRGRTRWYLRGGHSGASEFQQPPKRPYVTLGEFRGMSCEFAVELRKLCSSWDRCT